MKVLDLAVRRAYRECVEAYRDKRWAVSTNTEVELEDLGLGAEDRVGYAPSRWRTLRKILPAAEVGPDDVFVDFGSGKGRILLQAAAYPFRRIVGIDLSSELNAIARANVEARRAHLVCSDIAIVEGDVLDFAIPDDMTVAYFYNPFGGPIFQAVIDRLIASYDRCPRDIRIIYRNPVEEAALLATGRVRPVRASVELQPTLRLSQWRATRLYRVLPAAGR